MQRQRHRLNLCSGESIRMMTQGVGRTIEQALRQEQNFDLTHRLRMTDGSGSNT